MVSVLHRSFRRKFITYQNLTFNKCLIEMGNTRSAIIFKGDDYTYCGDVVYNKQKWQADGRGCYESRGYIYTGAFRKNHVWGQGTCTYENGVIYTGAWKTGFKHGKGKLMFADGDYYEGDFTFDLIHGKGKYVYEDGTYYIGRFCNNEMTGKGKLYSNAGVKLYSGEWLHDVFHGYGKYYYPDGRIQYQGHWKNSRAHGYGELVDASGNVWCGYFKNGEYMNAQTSVPSAPSTASNEESVFALSPRSEISAVSDITSEVSPPSARSRIHVGPPVQMPIPEKMTFRPCVIRKKEVSLINPIYAFQHPGAVSPMRLEVTSPTASPTASPVIILNPLLKGVRS